MVRHLKCWWDDVKHEYAKEILSEELASLATAYSSIRWYQAECRSLRADIAALEKKLNKLKKGKQK